MTTPTARSITLPRIAKALNSLMKLIVVPPVVVVGLPFPALRQERI
jgi:hypothetical protein